eukprot:14749903-Heterocapsa_arctica.AAC.1
MVRHSLRPLGFWHRRHLRQQLGNRKPTRTTTRRVKEKKISSCGPHRPTLTLPPRGCTRATSTTSTSSAENSPVIPWEVFFAGPRL